MFPGLFSEGVGRWKRVWDYWNQNVPLFGVKKSLTSSPVEVLILFNKKHQVGVGVGKGRVRGKGRDYVQKRGL